MIHIKSSDKDKFSKRDWVRLINSLSGAKSANLIGSISKDRKTNLAIISSVFHLGAAPPLMGFILRPHSQQSPRHTFVNIKETSFFTINHVNNKIFKNAHQTSARYPKYVSEFTECDLKEEFRGDFKAPFVFESKIQIGLQLLETIDIKHNKTHMIIGEIKEIFLKENYLREDGSIDVASAKTVAVTGLDEYHNLNTITRLSYAKPNIDIQEIS